MLVTATSFATYYLVTLVTATKVAQSFGNVALAAVVIHRHALLLEHLISVFVILAYALFKN